MIAVTPKSSQYAMFVRGAFLERCVWPSASECRRGPDCHRDRQTLAICPVFPHSLHCRALNRHRRRSCGPVQLAQEPLDSTSTPRCCSGPAQSRRTSSLAPYSPSSPAVVPWCTGSTRGTLVLWGEVKLPSRVMASVATASSTALVRDTSFFASNRRFTVSFCSPNTNRSRSAVSRSLKLQCCAVVRRAAR